MPAILPLVLLLAVPSAQQTGGPGIEALGWMAGHWIGTGEDLSEEIWLPPAAESMAGMWRWASKGQVRLYELLAITREGDGLVLRLRHFRPDLTAVEEKDAPFVLPLVKSGPNEAAFEGKGSDGGPLRITYRRPAPDRLEATVEKAGSRQEFSYRRRP